MNTLVKISFEDQKIVINKEFAERATTIGTQEYMMLTSAKNMVPHYEVEIRENVIE